MNQKITRLQEAIEDMTLRMFEENGRICADPDELRTTVRILTPLAAAFHSVDTKLIDQDQIYVRVLDRRLIMNAF